MKATWGAYAVTTAMMAILAGTAAPLWAEEPPAKGQASHVDLAICLDTSNSMDGLIDSAKQKLWAVVNELALASPRPVLRVALYQYGNDGLDRATGWVRQVCPLTDDLDGIYGKLFALRTNGGTEYVARVIRAATGELEWTAQPNALKMIIVAGNEPATQDREIQLKDACSAAVGKGIIINTIFCGSTQEGQTTGWADAAKWADGQFAAIDKDRGTVAIATPHDQKLTELSRKLNDTYVPYGAHGALGAATQAAQDANAVSVGAPAAADRAAAKSTGLYTNTAWDLVDAVQRDKLDLGKLEAKDLPGPMREMTDDQRREYVKEQAKARAEVQAEIQQLNDQRQQYIHQEMERRGLTDKDAFDTALRQAIRQQAQDKNMRFPDGQGGK